jgi:hypothetical protein
MVDKILYATILFAILIAIIIIVFVVSILRYHRRYGKASERADVCRNHHAGKRTPQNCQRSHDSIGPMLSSVKLNINSIEVKESVDEEIVQKAGRHLG